MNKKIFVHRYISWDKGNNFKYKVFKTLNILWEVKLNDELTARQLEKFVKNSWEVEIS